MIYYNGGIQYQGGGGYWGRNSCYRNWSMRLRSCRGSWDDSLNTLSPKVTTLNPRVSYLNPKVSTLALNPKVSTLNPTV